MHVYGRHYLNRMIVFEVLNKYVYLFVWSLNWITDFFLYFLILLHNKFWFWVNLKDHISYVGYLFIVTQKVKLITSSIYTKFNIHRDTGKVLWWRMKRRLHSNAFIDSQISEWEHLLNVQTIRETDLCK